MREKRNFAQRSRVLQSNEARKKYFLVYEGAQTEYIYFDAVHRLRQEIGINPLIELVPIVRDFSEEGWSNPKKILDRLIQNIQDSRNECITYEFLWNCIMEYVDSKIFTSQSKIAKMTMWEFLRKTCQIKFAASGSDVMQLEVILVC